MVERGRGSPRRGKRARTTPARRPQRARWCRAAADRVHALADNGLCRARQRPPPSFASPKWVIHGVIRAGRRIHYSTRMNESRELAGARASLAAAEAAWTSAEGLAHLEDGLDALADIIDGGKAPEARIAGNLAATYAGRFYGRV